MKRKVVVLEDDMLAMQKLCDILQGIDTEIEILRADNLRDANHIALNQHIHMFIVDIILNSENSGDISGLRFVQEIRKIQKYEFVPVIFVTSLEDPKFFSYSELNCLGYIEKPFDYRQVEKYVRRGLKFPIPEDEERCVYFRKDGIVYSKCISEIYYIEISRRKLVVHCLDENLEIPYKTSAEMLNEIDSPFFVQCSRYGIINRKYIEYIDYPRRYIKMKNSEDLIEIGVWMKKRFREEMERWA